MKIVTHGPNLPFANLSVAAVQLPDCGHSVRITHMGTIVSQTELKDADLKISMDGKGRWIDNRMIERLWRSLKYECIYLNAFETGTLARTGIGT